MTSAIGRAGRLALTGGAVGMVVPALLLALWEALSRYGVAPANLRRAP